MAHRNLAKENQELESICRNCVITDSQIFDIVKQGDVEKYNDYLKASITGLVTNAQKGYRDIMGNKYDAYLEEVITLILTNKFPIKKRIAIFQAATDGDLIGGCA